MSDQASAPTTLVEVPPSPFVLQGKHVDCLIAYVRRGVPIEDGDIPSKSGRDDLIEQGMVFQTLSNGKEGYTAISMAGVHALEAYYKIDSLAVLMASITQTKTPSK